MVWALCCSDWQSTIRVNKFVYGGEVRIPALTRDPNGCWFVAGSLRFETVVSIRTAFVPEPGGSSYLVDLRNVTDADSAGVALLIDWARQVNDVGGHIEYLNAPEQFRAIVEISGLSGALAGRMIAIEP